MGRALLLIPQTRVVSHLNRIPSQRLALTLVGTSSATTESRVEPDGSLVCPTPSPSQTPRSFAEVVVGPTTTEGSGSLVRSQCSEVNFRRSC